MKIHLVIPCFRERARLPRFLAELCESMDALGGVMIQVVDDGSGPAESRATSDAIEALRPLHHCLLPMLALADNLGKGGAVYAGWSVADPKTEWLGFVDADGSVTAQEVARVIGVARSLPVTDAGPPALFASRVKMLGRTVDRQFKRHLLGRVFATLVSELLDIPVYDSQCGLKLVPRAAFQSVHPQLKVNGFAFDVDLLVALIDHGTPVIEVPIDWHEEPGGKVHLLRDSWRMACDVWKIRQTRR